MATEEMNGRHVEGQTTPWRCQLAFGMASDRIHIANIVETKILAGQCKAYWNVPCLPLLKSGSPYPHTFKSIKLWEFQINEKWWCNDSSWHFRRFHSTQWVDLADLATELSNMSQAQCEQPSSGHTTLQGTNVSHQWERKLIFPTVFGWDMLVPRRVANMMQTMQPNSCWSSTNCAKRSKELFKVQVKSMFRS